MGIALADYEEKVLESLYLSGGVGVFVNVINTQTKSFSLSLVTFYPYYQHYYYYYYYYYKR